MFACYGCFSAISATLREVSALSPTFLRQIDVARCSRVKSIARRIGERPVASRLAQSRPADSRFPAWVLALIAAAIVALAWSLLLP